jgi:hypothetical protein
MTVSFDTLTTALVAGVCLCLGFAFVLGWRCARVVQRHRRAVANFLVSAKFESLIEVQAAHWAGARGLSHMAGEITSLLKETLRAIFAGDLETKHVNSN